MTKNRRALVGIALVVVAPALYACSSKSSSHEQSSKDAGSDAHSTTPTGDGGTGSDAAKTGTDGSMTTSDGQTTTSDGSTPTSDVGPPEDDASSGDTAPAGSEYAGLVSITQSVSAIATTSNVIAEFYMGSAIGTSSFCSFPNVMTMGSCCFLPPAQPVEAGVFEAGTFDASVPVYPNAGVVTVTDGTTAIATLTPSATDGIYPGDTMPGTWMPGDMLSVSAAGATVDSFTGTLLAISPLTGLTPALSDTMPAMIPESSDFTFTWTPDPKTTGATVALEMIAGGGILECSVTESSTTSTITAPTAFLSMFPKGTVILEATRTLASKASGGNVSVTLQMSSMAQGIGTLQ